MANSFPGVAPTFEVRDQGALTEKVGAHGHSSPDARGHIVLERSETAFKNNGRPTQKRPANDHVVLGAFVPGVADGA